MVGSKSPACISLNMHPVADLLSPRELFPSNEILPRGSRLYVYVSGRQIESNCHKKGGGEKEKLWQPPREDKWRKGRKVMKASGKVVLFVAVLSMFLGACASTIDQRGQKFEYKPDGIVIGQTTKRQVLESYGSPTSSEVRERRSSASVCLPSKISCQNQ